MPGRPLVSSSGVDRNTVDWRGYIPAITTPFDDDGAIDFDAWSELCEWMVEQRMLWERRLDQLDRYLETVDKTRDQKEQR